MIYFLGVAILIVLGAQTTLIRDELVEINKRLARIEEQLRR